MTIDVDTDVARDVSRALSDDADNTSDLRDSASTLRDAAELDDQGLLASEEFAEAYDRLVSLSDLIRLYGERMEAADSGNLDALADIDIEIHNAWGRFSDAYFDDSVTERGVDAYEYTVVERMQASMIEQELRDRGLLDGPTNSWYEEWLANSARHDVDPNEIYEIVDDHGFRPDDFEIFDRLEPIIDRDGKTYFLLPTDISGADAQHATLMTYVYNVDTGYATATNHHLNDYEATPYSSDEISRIAARQEGNAWSYNDDVGFVHLNGGRLATTPNGIMIGLGGNVLQDVYSVKGGTMWGDTFMINIDDPEDAQATLQAMIESGERWAQFSDGSIGPGASELDLDRLLHHEEMHARDWADRGYVGGAWYFVTSNDEAERVAGLSDGGYH